MPIDAAGPVTGAMKPIVRVLPHLTSAASLLAGAAGAAARSGVAQAAATIASAAPSASKAAVAVALLLLIRSPPWFSYPVLLPLVTILEPTCCRDRLGPLGSRTDGRPR